MIAWFLSRLSLTIGLVGVVLVAGGLRFASTSERFQRASSLEDTEMVGNRFAGSVNASFLDLLGRYPLGAGMGSATSIPYFLADVAPEPIGMENEYCRILVDQGWFGLGGWLAFLVWLFVRPPPSRPADPWWIGVVLMYSLTLAFWVTAIMGTGILSSIPGTVLLLTQMGSAGRRRTRGSVPEAVSILPGAPSEGEGFSSPLPLCGQEPGSGGWNALRPGQWHRLRISPPPILPRKGEGRWNTLCHKSCGRSPWKSPTPSPGLRRSPQDDRMAAGDRRLLPARRHGSGEPGPGAIPGRPRPSSPRHPPGLDDLAAHRNVVVHRVLRPFGRHILGGPLLGWVGQRWARRLAQEGFRVVVNGGNCQWADVNWVHYVHAASPAPATGGWAYRAKTRVHHALSLRSERLALGCARVVVCNSRRTAADVVNRLGVEPDRVRVVYLGVDPDRFPTVTPAERVAARTGLGWDDRPWVGFVGQLGTRVKGFDTLYAAWRELCRDPRWDANLAVVGTGANLPHVESPGRRRRPRRPGSIPRVPDRRPGYPGRV